MRWVRLGCLAAGVLLALGLGVAAWRMGPRAAPVRPVREDAASDVGGPFTLTDPTGRPATQHVLDGKWSAVFFGYTNCPDTCPATLQALNAAAGRLGDARRAFQVVFVSVDPARDTSAQMKLYVSAQGYPAGGLIGLTGTPAQVAKIASAYHVYYAKAGEGAGYAVQHSAVVYLMNPKGRFVRPLDETAPPQTLANQIRDAMAG